MAEEKKKVSVDVSLEQIVELDKSGADILFDTRPGSFKELTDEELKRISSRNRQRYATSREIWLDRKAEEPDSAILESVDAKLPPTLVEALGGYKINPEAGSSTKRLAIKEYPKGSNPSDFYYTRPEDVEDEQSMGSTIVTSGVISSANPSGKGVHRITRKGQDELILMRRQDRQKIFSEGVSRIGKHLSQGIDDSNQALNDSVQGAIRGKKFRDEDVRDQNFAPINE